VEATAASGRARALKEAVRAVFSSAQPSPRARKASERGFWPGVERGLGRSSGPAVGEAEGAGFPVRGEGVVRTKSRVTRRTAVERETVKYGPGPNWPKRRSSRVPPARPMLPAMMRRVKSVRLSLSVLSGAKGFRPPPCVLVRRA
jgi:hypothetical protein